MRRRNRVALVLLLLLALRPASAAAQARSELDITATKRLPAAAAAALERARASRELRGVGIPQGVDERYGVPTFVWATRTPGNAGAALRAGGAPAAARAHLARVAGLYGLAADDVAGARLRAIHDTGRGGIIATFTQVVDSVDVFRDEVKVLMGRDLGLLAVSGYLPPRSLGGRGRGAGFRIPAARAVQLALDDFAGASTPASGVRRIGPAEGGYDTYDVSDAVRGWPAGLVPGQAVRVKKVLFHQPESLDPAWYVEIMADDAALMYVVSAADGTLLFRHDMTASDAFGHRVWADGSGAFRPFDGPQGLVASPHPTGLPDNYDPVLVAPSLVVLQNSPFSRNDPWLAPGATQTLGNNVDAYVDLASPDGFSAGDLRASTTSANTFDRTYDTSLAPGASSNQRMAAVDQLFFDNNFFHDWWYDAGFDEAAGNAQTSNFGRGGLGGDPLRAEGQDYGGTNNANMATPADGGSPRMQMYVFNVAGLNRVTVTAAAGIAGDYAAGVAAFGPQSFTLSGGLIVGVDASSPTTDGCSALTNAAQVAGKIVLVDRGTCTFPAKALNAQAAGAIGCIIADNVAGSTPPALTGTGAVTIPVLSVTLDVGNALKTALMSGAVTLTMTRQPALSRDGTIDNQIVAHEWGHYISNRLIGDAAGLSTNMAGGLGEGWADFHALILTAREGDDLVASNPNWNGTYSAGGYALSSNVAPTWSYYFGVRRVPYSVDFAKNGLTFRHIANGEPLPVGPPTRFGASGANNAEVHATGEVWCTMLWECYVALLRDTGRLTFAQAQERMKDYLVAAYKLTPNAPTLLEARDALLAAAYATDPADYALFWDAFARRGAGVGAVAPDRFSSDNVPVVESYVVGGDLRVAAAGVTDDPGSCDGDGYLDNGELGTVSVTLANAGSTPLSATTLTLGSANPAVSFPAGNTVSLAPTAPFGVATASLPIVVTGATGVQLVDVTIQYDDPGLAVAGPRSETLNAWGNVDEVASASENVETLAPPWTMGGTPAGSGDWSVIQSTPTDHRFLGPDMGTATDHWLVSPPLQVAAAGNFTFSAQQRYSFEKDASNFYDGGVIEISTNGGASWSDIAAALTPPYGGTLYNASGNPLGGRSAYVGDSPGYPALSPITANLGTAYAGQTVRLRFRVACDLGVGGAGWELSSLTFGNLVNQPFFDLGPEASVCAPVAVGEDLPREVALALAGPNPAIGEARFRFALPREADVDLALFDVAGRLVARVAHGTYSPGYHTVAWGARAGEARPARGVYFARLLVGGQAYRQRIVLLR